MVHFPILSGRAYVVVAPEHTADVVISGSALLLTLAQPDNEGKTEKVVRLPPFGKWKFLGWFETLREEDASALVFRSRKGYFPDYTGDVGNRSGFATALESLASAVKADAARQASMDAMQSLLPFARCIVLKRS